MKSKNAETNHPAIVWGVWYLSLASLTTLISTFVLFFCVSVVIEMLHLDLLLSLSMLTAILMLPTNCYMLHEISKGRKIDPNSRLFCWDLWVCMATIIILNFIGACLCSHKIYHCKTCIKQAISKGMHYYKNNPTYKRLMDIFQWGLKCCGLDSYTDWFSQDWYDNMRDYEWDPASDMKQRTNGVAFVTDSVPQSCCKTGSCISNYLMEMGTSSIHLYGCAQLAYETVMTVLIIQLGIFSSVFVVEVIVLILALSKDDEASNATTKKRKTRVYDVKHILNVNPNFDSCGSLDSASDESDADGNFSGSPKKAVRNLPDDLMPSLP